MTPSLLVAPTTAQIEGFTKAQVLKRFLRDTGLGVYGAATDGDIESITDTTARASIQFSNDLYQGWWTRISAAGSTAPEDEIRVIDQYVGPSGYMRVLPTWSTAVAAGDSYELWRINPQLVLDMMDQVLLEDTYLPCWTILSEVPDFDMEQSVTTDWTGSNATVAKSTTEPLMSGKRYLTVTATSANGYARSPLFAVEPGGAYRAGAMGRYVTSNGSFIVYDETNSAAIETVTITRRHNVRVLVDFQVPATCHSISLRLSTVDNLGITAWDDVMLYGQAAHSIVLPWWVKNKSQVKGIFKLHMRDSYGDSIYSPELVGEIDSKWDIQDNAFGRGQLQLRARQGNLQDPLFIFGTRNETAFASNTEEKLVDMNFMIACLAYRIFSNLVQTPENSYLETSWLTERAEYWTRQWKQLGYQQMERLEQIFRSDSPQGSYLDSRFNF